MHRPPVAARYGGLSCGMDKIRVLLLVAVSTLAGCSLFSMDDHANALKTAVRDDQACAAKGFKYPDIQYVSCRMKLQDDRLHQAWLNMQLMHQTANQPNMIPPPYTGHEVYRPLDLAHFNCKLVTEDKRDYVLCAEDEKAHDAGQN